MDNKKLLKARAAIFEAEVLELEAELKKTTADPVKVEASVETVRTKHEELGEVIDAIAQEYIADDKEKELVDLEKQRGKYYKRIHGVIKSAEKYIPQVSVDAGTGSSQPRVNLPQRKLVDFDGDVRNWPAFWSSFEDIHADKKITDSEKFQLLLQSVPEGSPARKCIEGYTVSAKNYKAVVDTLTNLYGRPRMLIKVFVRDLLELVIQNARDDTKVDFMDLYPKLASHIRNLGDLGVTSDKCESILYPVVESCLPEDILLAWQRSTGYKEELEALMQFLNKEVHNTMDRQLAKMKFLAPTAVPGKGVKKSKGSSQSDIPTAAGFMVTGVTPGAGKREKRKFDKTFCVFCGDNRHESNKCSRAKLQMSVEDKIAVLKEKNCCFKCLRPGHSVRKCKRFVKCSICMGAHYEIICRGNSSETGVMKAAGSAEFGGYTYQGTQYYPTVYQQPPFNSMQQQNFGTVNPTPNQLADGKSGSAPAQQQNTTQHTARFTNISRNRRGSIVLMTFIAVMETPTGRCRVRVFIDSGSMESYIEKWCAEKFECVKVGEQTMLHDIFGAVTTDPIVHTEFSVNLANMDGRVRRTFIFNSIEKIANSIPKPESGSWMDDLEGRGIHLTDQSDATEEVQLLMGMDIASQIFTGKEVRLTQEFVARETIFGWVVGGTTPPPELRITRTNMVTSSIIDSHTMEELWSLEALGIKEDSKSESKEDLEKATIAHFKNTVRRKQDGRYVVEMPMIEGHRKLVGNFNQAYSRLRNETEKLKRKGFWDHYDKIFKEWEEDKIIHKADSGNEMKMRELYLLPHRHVLKENSSTTPVRPVFDASAKGTGGPSLNDILEKGPNLLELIPAIMCRFRKLRVGAVSDVKKAFLQIELSWKDQEMLHFLWWKDDRCQDLQLYRHQRVVFGVKPSPFLLAATLKYHVESCEEQQNFKEALLNSLYVDNSCSSHASLEDAVLFKEKAQTVLLPAHFDLRGWEFSYSEKENNVPVLGMNWETHRDTISLCMDSLRKKLNSSMTKKGLLAMVNSVFDPLGYVCAFTIQPKLWLQECHNMKLNWDQPLPEEIEKKVLKWKAQVPVLEELKIPRWLNLDDNLDRVSLHCFSDACGTGYASYIFIRREFGDQVAVQLVMGKSRVAPLKKKITIPRLELLGCEIGALLTVNSVVKFLELEGAPRHFWTDSSTALAWIKQDKEWATFVANRVKVIRRLTSSDEWHHIPGEWNPADVPSRGCGARKLVESRFWEGPEWLRLPADQWPKSAVSCNEEDVDAEKRKTVVSAMAKVKKNDLMQHFLRYSSYKIALRVLVYVLRYIKSLHVRSKSQVGKPEKRQLEIITADEIARAETVIIRWIQDSRFVGVDDSRIIGMGAFKDKDGLIRIKTQLLYGHEDFGLRCPVVLPNEHPMVKTIIRREHLHWNHAGVQILQARLRERFWILRSRRTISGVVNSCWECRRLSVKRCEVPSTPLPLDRIRDTVAFDVTGVDLAGPLTLKGGQKSWIVLFTCAVYRAVHLELVTTLSTRGFMMALQRFVARRGRPTTIYSDNGLNFVGCSNLFKKVDWTEVARFAAVDRISWKFNPPSAAWWGGWWERLVGLTKQLLRRVLGRKCLEYEELLTVLCDVEGTLNQRPLTYVSDNKEDLRPLCPAQFIKDNPASNLPEAEVVEGESLRVRAKFCQKVKQDLRSRFRKEYLGQLQHRGGKKTRTVKPGDVVLIEDENRKRLEWPIGLVKEVFPGRDGEIRTALVKTKDGEFLRPVQRLFLMEVAEIEDEVEEVGASLESPPDQEMRTRFGRKIVKPSRY